MKNLYPKGKGKIHPSPSCPGGPSGDAVAVLSLLPAAILALTAALGAEDREVLAYLVTRSLQGPWSVVAEERRRCRRQSLHQPLFDCGCFDCYTSYWYRWDSSPDRELIHQAIEAFEEHLASSEQRRSGGKGSRRRDRRVGERADKVKRQADERGNSKRRTMKDEEGKDKASSVSGAGVGEEEAPASSVFGEESPEVAACAEEVVPEEGLGSDGESSKELDGETGIEMVALSQQQGGERRRAWQDVMGLFGSRLWGLWGPAA